MPLFLHYIPTFLKPLPFYLYHIIYSEEGHWAIFLQSPLAWQFPEVGFIQYITFLSSWVYPHSFKEGNPPLS